MTAVQHELDSRGRIISSARHLFCVQGFHQTPMSELASGAHVSVGQIYRVFKNKDDIILAIVREDSDRRFEALAKLTAKVASGEMSIEAGFTRVAMLALSDEDEALSFDILAEAHRNADVAQEIASLCVRYRALMRELARLANPALADADLDGVEELLLACMFGLGHRRLSRPTLSVAETATQTARMIVTALRSGEGAWLFQDTSERAR